LLGPALPQNVSSNHSSEIYQVKRDIDATTVAQSFGYTVEQLESIPKESHMGLGCGNPTVTATLKQGETVLDLGSGGGIDIFLAASKIGPHGKAIGLDMSSVGHPHRHESRFHWNFNFRT
jgi:hypothetical protein